MTADPIHTAVNTAGRIAHTTKSVRETHERALKESLTQASERLWDLDLRTTLREVSHLYVAGEDKLTYLLSLECTNTGHLPRSTGSVRRALEGAGITVDSVDYSTNRETTTCVLRKTMPIEAHSTRQLSEDDPDFAVDATAVPEPVSKLVVAQSLSEQEQARVGIVRSPAVRSLKIDSKRVFNKRKRGPKPLIKKKSHKKESPSVFSWDYWFGGSEKKKAKKLAEAYAEEQDIFVY